MSKIRSPARRAQSLSAQRIHGLAAERIDSVPPVVRNKGCDLAKCTDGNPVPLMRGHGFASAARILIEVVRLSVYLPRNARLMRAKQRDGEIKYLARGEIDARKRDFSPGSLEAWRTWELWAHKAGCHLLTQPGTGRMYIAHKRQHAC